jgi:hypothetical protein
MRTRRYNPAEITAVTEPKLTFGTLAKLVRAVCFVLLLSAASVASAQTYGEITGTITDASGAAIAGAEVLVTNLATNQMRQVTSSDAGAFTAPFLVPGRYRVEAKATGFKIAVAADRLLQVGDVLRVDLALELGAVTESIEVAASAEMLQTSSTATGTVVEQKRIVELPLNGRNYLQLVKLAPNVTAEMGAGGQADGRQGGERANQALSIAGMRQQYNHFTLDGVENTDVNFNTFVVRPSVDALQEFKVQTGVYSAEFGRSPSQINVNTKPGTNQYHGVLFEFLRNDAIQARPWLADGPKNPFRRNQFGFTLDGPVSIPKLFNGRDRLFFMANYEGLRERVYSVRRATVADEAMIRGDFSAPQHFPIYDPQTFRAGVNGGPPTAQQFPNNQIPASLIDPTFVKLLEFYARPNVPGAVVGVSPFNYVRNAPSPNDWDQFTSRVDFNESVGSQWFGRLSWGNELDIAGNTFPSQDARVATTTWQFMTSNVRTFSPTVVNELRIGAFIFDNDKGTVLNGVRDVTSELNIPGLPPPIPEAWGAPAVGFSGNNLVSGWGETTEAPFVIRNRTYQILNNLSWVRGTHTWKFGGEITNRRFNQIGNQFPRGFFEFPHRYTAHPANISRTGSAFATGLLGWTQEATRALGLANTQFRQWSQAYYVEDVWRVRSNLTFNIGLRYEYTPPFADRHRGIFNVQLFCSGVTPDLRIDPNCPVPVLVRPGPGDFHEDLNVRMADNIPKAAGDEVLHGRATVMPDRNDFAPRIGIAWQPGSRWTVRTGYGLFYAQDTINPVWDMARNLGFRESARSLDLIPTAPLSNPWAIKGVDSGTCANWDGLCLSGLYTFSNEVARRTAYVHQYLLNVQHQLTDSLMLELGYQGNAGHKLQRMYGWNDPVYRNGPDDTRSANERRPWGGSIYGRIQTIGGHVNSNYNSGIVKVQQRFSSGLTYLLGYTWSRAIDDGSGIRTNNGDNLFPANNYDFSSERALSQFHQLHRFTGSILYELPLGRGKKDLGRFGNAVLGDWSMGSIITIGSGTPFNGGACGDLAGITQASRGDATGISPYLDDPTPQQYYRRDASGRGAAAITCTTLDAQGVNELTYREGNVARNAYIGPGVFNWDFSAMKRFRFGERANLEFRFESFNFPNHPNWGTPNTNLTSPQYGQITSARAMRTNQFGLKFAF